MDESSILHARIRQAFSGISRPLPSEIPECCCEECAWIGGRFGDVDPFNVDKDWLREHVDLISELSASAQRYFMPMWLSEAVIHPFSDSAYALAPFTANRCVRVAQVPYSDAQRDVLQQVLLRIARHHPAPDGDEFVQAAELWRTQNL